MKQQKEKLQTYCFVFIFFSFWKLFEIFQTCFGIVSWSKKFRWTFSRAEGSLALPQPEGACAAPTKGCLRCPNQRVVSGGRIWWELLRIAENCWKLMKIAGNYCKLMKIVENSWTSMKILMKNFRDPKVVRNFLTDFTNYFRRENFIKKDSK